MLATRVGMGLFKNAKVVRFVAESQSLGSGEQNSLFVSVEMGRVTWGQ